MPSKIAFAGYADANTPYTYSSNIQTVLNNLHEAIELFELFSTNHPVANVDKCHLLTNSKTATDIHISYATILNEKRVKLLGITLESRLNFNFKIDTLIKKGL